MDKMKKLFRFNNQTGLQYLHAKEDLNSFQSMDEKQSRIYIPNDIGIKKTSRLVLC